MSKTVIPLMASIPHSGEKVPELCSWLGGLSEPTLMCDVDRFVDLLYQATLERLQIPFCRTDWHRYAVDLNRVPTDIDSDSVVGSPNPPGSFARGFHWVMTTTKQRLMHQPMTEQAHQELTKLIYEPFHQQLKELYQRFPGCQNIYHLDLHSMPSLGTSEHRDPGQHRKDVVVSDSKGVSSSPEFKDLVIKSFENQGFTVSYNWPYYGGRITEQYGQPAIGHHVVQVELNRALYMNEQTKKLHAEGIDALKARLSQAISDIHSGITMQVSKTKI